MIAARLRSHGALFDHLRNSGKTSLRRGTAATTVTSSRRPLVATSVTLDDQQENEPAKLEPHSNFFASSGVAPCLFDPVAGLLSGAAASLTI
jgi:hypothetical protein